MLVNVFEGDKVDSLLTLKRKTDVNGRPCMNKWCPDSESNQGHGDFQSLKKRPNDLLELTAFYWFTLRKMLQLGAISLK
ncbi:hypothetical protein D9I00_19975 [Escherichia coli]|nr:hypothetical protein [Escherichia coli]